MQKHLNSINAKLVLLISSVLCITILVIFIATFLILNGFQRKNVSQVLGRTELLVNSLVTAKLQELKVQSQLVGELPILNTAVENGEINTIRDIGRTYRDNLGASIFDILDREGGIIASINGNMPPDDTLSAALAMKILEEGGLCTVFQRGGRLVLLGGAPIGTSEDPSGVLMVGMDLDSAFARQVRDFTRSEISFLVGGLVRGSSLPPGEQAILASVSPGKLDDGKYARKGLALKDHDGNILGEAIIQLPLEEHHRMLATLKYILAGIGALVFLLACALSFRFSMGFTRPIADAVRFAQKLAAGDRDTPIEINRSDELGVLQESLERMRISLQGLIGDLDAKVKAGIRHVSNILDNLEGGFLIFDRTGTVQQGYSRISEDIFGNALAGRKLEEILRIDSATWEDIHGWREVLFGGRIPFKDAAYLGPGSFEKLEGRYIELSYRPIYIGTRLDGVILIATDRTRERELYRKFDLEKERVEMIIKITTNLEGFLDFVRDARNCIFDISSRLEAEGEPNLDVDSALRAMHTLKGNSAMYSCSQIKTIAHSLETSLSEFRELQGQDAQIYRSMLREGIAALEEAIANVFKENSAFLGDYKLGSGGVRKLLVNDALLTSLEESLLQHFQSESVVYRKFRDNFILEPVLSPLKKFESMALDLADRRQKLIKPFFWEGGEVKARLGAYKSLFASLIHAFRNAVDHGIEIPEIREDSGKEPEGQISVRVQRSGEEGNMLRIHIRDDGKGIDPAEIRRKIEEGMISTETDASSLSDWEVIQLVFRNGFTTAEGVTEVSGRGVGMEAIAYEAGKLGGRVWIESEVGLGMELIVEVPLIE